MKALLPRRATPWHDARAPAGLADRRNLLEKAACAPELP
jgi:hypothetical protein